ncbi:MAG: A/G-specific adenine glycosylase, partial [Limnochordales bacterium]
MSGGGTPGGRRLGEALVRWFEEHKRALPWRQNRDPYRVWVAEVMLQQTRVDTVAPRYVSFLRRFPSVEALAAAGEDEVLKEWEGLGYYSRARNLRLAAREIVNRYGGRFPDSPEELRRLPGIGRYTAAAVASIAFNRPAAAVDGNVLRVMARLHGIDEPVTRAPVQRRIERLTEALIPPGRAADFTEALMELGALVCTPGQPDCGRCPWRDAWTAYLG